MNKRTPDNIVQRLHAGVTLIELMIVVAIVTIIASIAYPSYTQFVMKSKRAAGSAFLMQVADRQQQFFLDNKQYAADLTALGFATTEVTINDDGTVVAVGDDRQTYEVSLANATPTAYMLEAAPLEAQASHDTDCGTLNINSAGVKGQSGAGENCW